jgi:hypothetical protein
MAQINRRLGCDSMIDGTFHNMPSRKNTDAQGRV